MREHLPVRITRGKAKHKVGEDAMMVQKQSFSIREFCEQHAISRSFFYVLREKGEAPRLMKVGRRTLISAEAAAEWRKNMEHITITKQRIA